LRVTGFSVEDFYSVIFPEIGPRLEGSDPSIFGPKKILSIKSFVVMVLFFLRIGHSFCDIAPFFGMSVPSVQRIVKKAIHRNAKILAD